jgi:hypothetical protein
MAGWATLGFLLSSGLGNAHSWYDLSCCSEKDCHPVPQEELEQDGNGDWVHLPTGLRFHGSMIKPSQDKHWHICYSPDNGIHKDIPYCVYIQQGF